MGFVYSNPSYIYYSVMYNEKFITSEIFEIGDYLNISKKFLEKETRMRKVVYLVD